MAHKASLTKDHFPAIEDYHNNDSCLEEEHCCMAFSLGLVGRHERKVVRGYR